jgi:hypothetical protein
MVTAIRNLKLHNKKNKNKSCPMPHTPSKKGKKPNFNNNVKTRMLLIANCATRRSIIEGKNEEMF